jgi:putative PIN family toxin of toxin-antitoxin system|tara:strand:- start:491 stop:913 length:423 start_codon:yes stop_codon:yes gene_type:complete
LKIVLDTNAILRCLSSKSPYSFVLDDLIDGKYQLYLTKEILLEYEEKTIDIFSPNTAEVLMGTLNMSNYVHFVDVFFNLNLIHKDQDDNKFVDCAFAANAHFIVTNDKHFNILKNIDFPKLNTINLEDFTDLLKKEKSGN